MYTGGKVIGGRGFQSSDWSAKRVQGGTRARKNASKTIASRCVVLSPSTICVSSTRWSIHFCFVFVIAPTGGSLLLLVLREEGRVSCGGDPRRIIGDAPFAAALGSSFFLLPGGGGWGEGL